MAGAATAAVALTPGAQLSVEINGYGECAFTCTGQAQGAGS